MKIDQRCSPVAVVSDNIRFMRIFAGVPWTGGVKCRFSGLSDYVFGILGNEANIVAFPLTPKYTTLNGHCTLNFQYYVQSFENLFLRTYRRACLYHVTSGDVRKRTVIRGIFGIRGWTADLS